MKYFTTQIDADGVALVTFERPPVNAVSAEVYPIIRDLSRELSSDDRVRCVVLAASADARAWCGGADLKEFVALDYETKLARYAMINECLPEFYHLDRPVIAAISSHAIGVGLVLASFCDIRIAAETACFWAPEIDRGSIAGGGAFFFRLNMAQGTIREIIYTGRRFSAEEMQRAGFIDHVYPRSEVLDRSLDLARVIAKKSLPALRANKAAINVSEELSWQEGYRASNEASSRLTAGKDAKEGLAAFFAGRSPNYADE